MMLRLGSAKTDITVEARCEIRDGIQVPLRLASGPYSDDMSPRDLLYRHHNDVMKARKRFGTAEGSVYLDFI